MRLQNLTWNIARLVLASALTVFLGAIAAAQIAGQSADSARYSEREAHFSKMRERQNDTSAVKTGWLILEGRFVEPPYTVATTDSSVTVNGLDVFVSKPKRFEDKPEPAVTGYYAAIVEADRIFDSLHEVRGFAGARDSMVKFLQQHQLMDTAYVLTERIIRYKSTDNDWESEIWLREKPDSSLLDHARQTQNRLQAYASRLAIPLNEGALVIKEGGYGTSINYPESETALRQLREVASSIPDFAERKKRIQEIIGNEKYAEKIAREFK
jgi:hypothetical protein